MQRSLTPVSLHQALYEFAVSWEIALCVYIVMTQSGKVEGVMRKAQLTSCGSQRRWCFLAAGSFDLGLEGWIRTRWLKTGHVGGGGQFRHKEQKVVSLLG